MDKHTLPIGLFDSGIGGLTVARQVLRLMPQENTIYFGDSARVPYGSKSSETVIGYTRQAIAFLESKGVKLIIIACNTASAVALAQAQAVATVPVIGVIEPGAQAAVAASRSGMIGVIGTEGTIRSQAYQQAIRHSLPVAQVEAQACPLLVAFAEEGLSEHPATLMITREYLSPMLGKSIDALVMGCTHYPLLEPSIARVAGERVSLIDPGIATAAYAEQVLKELDILNDSTTPARHDYYLSDFPHKFVEVGERFLGKKMEHIARISLDDLALFA